MTQLHIDLIMPAAVRALVAAKSAKPETPRVPAGKEKSARVTKLQTKHAQLVTVAQTFLSDLQAALHPSQAPLPAEVDWSASGPMAAIQVVQHTLTLYRQGAIGQTQALSSVHRALAPFPPVLAQFRACVDAVGHSLAEVCRCSACDCPCCSVCDCPSVAVAASSSGLGTDRSTACGAASCDEHTFTPAAFAGGRCHRGVDESLDVASARADR